MMPITTRQRRMRFQIMFKGLDSIKMETDKVIPKVSYTDWVSTQEVDTHWEISHVAFLYADSFI